MYLNGDKNNNILSGQCGQNLKKENERFFISIKNNYFKFSISNNFSIKNFKNFLQ